MTTPEKPKGRFELPFDIYALVKPKTPEDKKALIEEALRSAQQLEETVDKMRKELALAKARQEDRKRDGKS